MPKRPPDRVLLSVRIDTEVARRARELCRNQAGSPLFLRLGTFVQQAIVNQIAATEAQLADGARPAERRDLIRDQPSRNHRPR